MLDTRDPIGSDLKILWSYSQSSQIINNWGLSKQQRENEKLNIQVPPGPDPVVQRSPLLGCMMEVLRLACEGSNNIPSGHLAPHNGRQMVFIKRSRLYWDKLGTGDLRHASNGHSYKYIIIWGDQSVTISMDAADIRCVRVAVWMCHSCQNSSQCFCFRAAQQRAKLTFDSLL